MILHNDKKKNMMLATTCVSQKNKRTQIQSKIMSLQKRLYEYELQSKINL